MGKIYAAKQIISQTLLGFYLKPLVFSWKVKGGEDRKTETCKDCDQQEQNPADICHDTGRQSGTVSLQEWNLNRSRIQDIYRKVIVTMMQEVTESDTQSF